MTLTESKGGEEERELQFLCFPTLPEAKSSSWEGHCPPRWQSSDRPSLLLQHDPSVAFVLSRHSDLLKLFGRRYGAIN